MKSGRVHAAAALSLRARPSCANRLSIERTSSSWTVKSAPTPKTAGLQQSRSGQPLARSLVLPCATQRGRSCGEQPEKPGPPFPAAPDPPPDAADPFAPPPASQRFPPGRPPPPPADPACPVPPPPGTPPPPNPGPPPPGPEPPPPREPSAARIICNKRLGSSRKSLNLSPCAPSTFAVRFAAIFAPATEESSAT